MDNSKKQKIKVIEADLIKAGIDNPFLLIAITAVIEKESGFILRREAGYKNTSAERLKKIFVTRLKGLSDASVDALKKDEIKFFNYVYNGIMGNKINSNDGFIFRGAGLNQLTGRANFAEYGKALNLPLEEKPELLNNFETASKVVALFFVKWLNIGLAKGSFKKFGVTTLSDIKNVDTALNVAYQINAGLGTDISNDFFTANIEKSKKWVKDFLKSPTGGSIAGLVLIFIFGFLYYKNK